jgi:hypothetical protein
MEWVDSDRVLVVVGRAAGDLDLALKRSRKVKEKKKRVSDAHSQTRDDS